jgi:hypothetical protein
LLVLFLLKGSVTYFDAHIIFLISILGFIFIQLIILKKLYNSISSFNCKRKFIYCINIDALSQK